MEITASMVKQLREISGAGMMDCKKALEASNGDIDAALDYLRENGMAKANKKEGRIAAEGLTNIYVDGNKAVIVELNSETDFVSKNEEFKNLLDTIGQTLLKSDAKTLDEANELKTESGETIKDLIVAKIAKIGEKLSFRRFEILTKKDNENFGSYLHMGGRIASLVVVEGANEEVAKDVAMQQAAMRPSYTFIEDVPEDVVAKEKEIQKELAMKEGKPEDIAQKMVEGRIKKFYKEICLNEQAFVKDNNLSIKTYLANNKGTLKYAVRYEVGEGMEKKSEDFANEVMKQIEGK